MPYESDSSSILARLSCNPYSSPRQTEVLSKFRQKSKHEKASYKIGNTVNELLKKHEEKIQNDLEICQRIEKDNTKMKSKMRNINPINNNLERSHFPPSVDGPIYLDSVSSPICNPKLRGKKTGSEEGFLSMPLLSVNSLNHDTVTEVIIDDSLNYKKMEKFGKTIPNLTEGSRCEKEFYWDMNCEDSDSILTTSDGIPEDDNLIYIANELPDEMEYDLTYQNVDETPFSNSASESNSAISEDTADEICPPLIPLSPNDCKSFSSLDDKCFDDFKMSEHSISNSEFKGYLESSEITLKNKNCNSAFSVTSPRMTSFEESEKSTFSNEISRNCDEQPFMNERPHSNGTTRGKESNWNKSQKANTRRRYPNDSKIRNDNKIANTNNKTALKSITSNKKVNSTVAATKKNPPKSKSISVISEARLCENQISSDASLNVDTTPKKTIYYSSIEIIGTPNVKDTADTTTTTFKDKSSVMSFIQPNTKECVEAWKELNGWGWMEYDDNTSTFTCSLCAPFCPSSTCTVWEIKNPNDKYSVVSQLRRHSLTKQHMLAPLLNKSLFYDLYRVLKYSYLYRTREILFESLNNNIQKHGGERVSEDVLKFFIKEISLTVNVMIIDYVRENENNGVSYIVDPCRRLLIARFFNKKYLEEHLIIDFMNSSMKINDYLKTRTLSTSKITFTNQRMLCGSCSHCKDIQHIDDENTLPPRHPKIEDLLKWVQDDPYFKKYCVFVKNMAHLYNSFQNIFQQYFKNHFTSGNRWEDYNTYDFIFQNFYVLKTIFYNIYKTSRNLRAKECFRYDLNRDKSFRESLILLSFICKESQYKASLNSILPVIEQFCSKMKEENQKLPTSIKYFQLYGQEMIKKGYCYGRKNVAAFRLFFVPTALATIGHNTSRSRAIRQTFDKIYFLLKPHLAVPKEILLLSLESFGIYLVSRGARTYLSMNEMICYLVSMKDKFSLPLKFYSLFISLPIFIPLVQKSFFDSWLTLTHLTRMFGSDMAIDLCSIHLEGDEPIVTSSNLHTHFVQAVFSV